MNVGCGIVHVFSHESLLKFTKKRLLKVTESYHKKSLMKFNEV